MPFVLPGFLGIAAYFQDGFDLLPPERLNRRSFEFWCRYHFYRIGDLELVTNPVEKCRQSHPYIADRFGGLLHLDMTGEPARYIIGQKLGDVLV
jgi:hypothetical protein